MKRLIIPLVVFALAAVAVVAFVVDGHTESGTPSERLASWVSSTGVGQQIGTIRGEAADVVKAAREHKSLTVFHTICAAMEEDSQTYNDSLPSPDIAVTDDLAKAYSDSYDAAEACYRSGDTDKKLLAQSEADSANADQLFEAALTRIAEATGKRVSTTTTTALATTTTTFF